MTIAVDWDEKQQNKQSKLMVSRQSCRPPDKSAYPPDKSAYWKIIFFISHPKYMVWVLKRTVSVRRFFWAPKTCLNRWVRK